MSTTNNRPPPILLNGETDCLNDLVCTVCHEIPFVDPVVTKPCGHVFCRACLDAFFASSARALTCPNDRTPLNGYGDIMDMDGVLRRVWEKIRVRCPHLDCGWKGTMEGYACHIREECRATAAPVQNLMVEDLKADNENLKSENERLRTQLADTEIELEATRLARDQVDRVTTTQLEDCLKAMRKLYRQRHGFDRDYKYDRHRVVELCQIICRDLKNCPESLDRNRIFNCVKSCYDDFARGYSDNPSHYDMNLKMLLYTCLASTWFTPNQRSNIQLWCQLL